MSRSLTVGVQLPEVEYEARWPELRDMTIAAEDVGFDSVWTGDHLLYKNAGAPAAGPWESWSLLAALAAVTTRIQLGPLVASTSFHSPTMLAKKAATVDEISEGRLILGLGAGWNKADYQALGVPFDHRASRFIEAFTIIRTLLQEGEIDFDGTYYQIRDCEILPRPRPGGPPLMIGSIGSRILEATLPHVELWNTWHAWYGNSATGLKELVKKIDDACREVGRDPNSVAKTATALIALDGATGRGHPRPSVPRSQPLIAHSGSVNELAETLHSLSATGVTSLQLVLDPITRESIVAMGEVLAALDAIPPIPGSSS